MNCYKILKIAPSKEDTITISKCCGMYLFVLARLKYFTIFIPSVLHHSMSGSINEGQTTFQVFNTIMR